jgi:hypothetical protein
MVSLLLLALSMGPADDKPKPRPAAILLVVKGRAEIRPMDGTPRVAEVGDLIYSDEVLVVPPDGSATVSILGVGASEAIRPGAEAKVGPAGCSPPGSVLSRKDQPRAVAATMKNLRPAPGDGRKAGVGFRSGPESPPALTPILGATVASDRPGFAWPADDKATTYRFRLSTGAGREVWKAESKEPRLDFPADKGPLTAGYVYRWEVTDQDYHEVASGEFSVPTASERGQLDELKALVASGDAADRYSASVAYRRLAAFAEALAVLESLVKDEPGVEAYRRELAELQRRAGREDSTK